MTFGASEGIFAGIAKVGRQDLAGEIVARALDAGINHFNTADVYTSGNSERILGRALGARRKDVVISTKVGGRTGEALPLLKRALKEQPGLSRGHYYLGAVLVGISISISATVFALAGRARMAGSDEV